MKYNPFGILRPGALVDEEEQEYLNKHIYALEAIPGWAEKAATLVAAYTGDSIPATIDGLQMYLYKVKTSRDSVPTSTLRYYADTLAAISQLLSQGASMPAQAPVTAPEEPVVASQQPATSEATITAEEILAANPPAPPGITCPHYNRALQPPTNWDDPAAGDRYLQKYPDVMEAVSRKIQPSALWHFRCYGRNEGRTWAGLGGYPRSRKSRPGMLGDVRVNGQGYSAKRVRRPGNL